jgi:hypothetical protein
MGNNARMENRRCSLLAQEWPLSDKDNRATICWRRRRTT